MFVTNTNVVSLQRLVATVVALAITLWSIGAWSQAEAANVLEFSDTLSTSAPSVAADHEIEFTVVDAVLAAETIVLTFPSTPDTFGFGTVGADDVAVYDDGVLLTGGGTDYTAVVSDPTITITMVNPIAAGSTTTIMVGTNAGGSGDQLTNPATADVSYEIDVTAGNEDTGSTRVAIVSQVTVTAQVDTTFDFVINGVAQGVPVNGTTTTGSTSALQIPFGLLEANVPSTTAQNLQVWTNARNGFVVTVEQDGNLRSANGADIDGFDDGSYNDDPSVAAGNWSSPGEDVNDEDTWGHWGLTSMDDLNGGEFQSCPQAATGGCWVAASTTPREIFSHDGPANGTTNSIGSTTVAYQVEISPLQEAADDYETTLTYIATPTF